MHPSVRALLNQIIDYAGLFPPAKLPVEDALRNYLRYRKESPHRWMLGRFVCPAGRLQELLALAKSHPHADLLSLTVLGQQGSDFSDSVARLDTDIAAIQDFRGAWGNNAVIDMIEIPLPKAGVLDGFSSYLGYVAEQLVQKDLRGFLENAMAPTWRDDVAKTADAVSSCQSTYESRALGLKLRCGGVTAEAFPSDADIAFFIDRCRAARLAWKATAGLHHPRRHWDVNLHVWHQGFLNLFIADLLAQIHPLSQADIVAILADRDGGHFHFEAEAIGWKAWSCTTPQVTELRATSATTFGSCSFDEPCTDLVAMGLLDATAKPNAV